MEKAPVHSPQTNQRKTQSTEFYQQGDPGGSLEERATSTHSCHFLSLPRGTAITWEKECLDFVIRSLGFDSYQAFYKVTQWTVSFTKSPGIFSASPCILELSPVPAAW